jgi:hypothetical protein
MIHTPRLQEAFRLVAASVLELVLGLEVLGLVLGLDLGKLLNICAHTGVVPMFCIVHLLDQKCVYTMTVCDL